MFHLYEQHKVNSILFPIKQLVDDSPAQARELTLFTLL